MKKYVYEIIKDTKVSVEIENRFDLHDHSKVSNISEIVINEMRLLPTFSPIYNFFGQRPNYFFLSF